MFQKGRALGAILIGVLYLLNVGSGIFELIPDNIPFVGNLDEGAATLLILWGWRKWKAIQKV